LVLTFLFVLMTTHAGTGLFCLVRFINRFLREVFFRAAIYDRRIPFFRFLSVGVPSLPHPEKYEDHHKRYGSKRKGVLGVHNRRQSYLQAKVQRDACRDQAENDKPVTSHLEFFNVPVWVLQVMVDHRHDKKR
jgi:hypothetical protein